MIVPCRFFPYPCHFPCPTPLISHHSTRPVDVHSWTQKDIGTTGGAFLAQDLAHPEDDLLKTIKENRGFCTLEGKKYIKLFVNRLPPLKETEGAGCFWILQVESGISVSISTSIPSSQAFTLNCHSKSSSKVAAKALKHLSRCAEEQAIVAASTPLAASLPQRLTFLSCLDFLNSLENDVRISRTPLIVSQTNLLYAKNKKPMYVDNHILQPVPHVAPIAPGLGDSAAPLSPCRP